MLFLTEPGFCTRCSLMGLPTTSLPLFHPPGERFPLVLRIHLPPENFPSPGQVRHVPRVLTAPSILLSLSLPWTLAQVGGH